MSTGNIKDVEAADEKRIADEGPVAPPGYRLGAHDRDSLFLGDSDQLCQTYIEVIRLHIVGKASK